MSTRKKPTYELKAFTPSTLKATRVAWTKSLNKLASALPGGAFKRVLDWADGHACYDSEQDTFAYGVFQSDSDAALAIAEVSYTKSGAKWLKMLDLNLSPDLDVSLNEGDRNLQAIGSVYAEAIAGTLRLTAVHKSGVVKLYARSASLLVFFKGLAAVLEAGTLGTIVVTVEGRWLVIKQK